VAEKYGSGEPLVCRAFNSVSNMLMCGSVCIHKHTVHCDIQNMWTRSLFGRTYNSARDSPWSTACSNHMRHGIWNIQSLWHNVDFCPINNGFCKYSLCRKNVFQKWCLRIFNVSARSRSQVYSYSHITYYYYYYYYCLTFLKNTAWWWPP